MQPDHNSKTLCRIDFPLGYFCWKFVTIFQDVSFSSKHFGWLSRDKIFLSFYILTKISGFLVVNSKQHVSSLPLVAPPSRELALPFFPDSFLWCHTWTTHTCRALCFVIRMQSV